MSASSITTSESINAIFGTHVHQTETRYDVVAILSPAGAIRSGRAARVDEELVHVLEALEAVCAAPAQHVDVQLVGLREQQVRLVRHQREALQEADADVAVRDNLCERQGGGLDVEPPLDDLQVRRYCSQVFVCVLVCEVAEAEGLPDLARCKELLKLRWSSVSFAAHAAIRRQTVPWREYPELGQGCEGHQ